MALWNVVGALVGILPTKVMRHMPGRYSLQPGLRGAVNKARLMHLPTLLGLLLLLVAIMFQEDTRTLSHLKSGAAIHYMALVPPHPDGLSTGQLWPVLRQVVSSALDIQNITHNGTFKGVASLRQFRLTKEQTHSFFQSCDASILNKQPLAAPDASQVHSAWRYSPVRQVWWVIGQHCSYPPEGYNVYLGDLQNHSATRDSSTPVPAAKQGIYSNEVLKEALWILDDLQQYAWVDDLTVALLLTLLAPQPGTATPTAITIIFENTRHFSRRDRNLRLPTLWWASHALAAVDLRPNILPSVLLAVFLAVHLFVTWAETGVSFNLLRTEPGLAARRCLTLATVVQGVILALHSGVLYLHFTAKVEAHREISRYYVSYDMKFNPEEYKEQSSELLDRDFKLVGEGIGMDRDDNQGVGPSLNWDPEYKTQVRRITLARILELKGIYWTLITTEVMLYLVSFVLFPQHHNETIHTAMRTLRGGLKRSLVLVVPLLTLFILTFYFIHISEHTGEEDKDFHSFASELKETLNTVIGPGKGSEAPLSVKEWLTEVVLLAVGVVVTLLLWRVCLSPDESRARRTQRLPLYPL